MSGLIVGLVLRTPITEEFNTEAKFIATVYADHAWEDGTHAYPAVPTVATITGLSDRTVQRYLSILKAIGMLVATGKGPRGTTRYDFPLVESKDGSVRLALQRGDTQSPRQTDTGDTESGDTESGDTAVSPKSITRHDLIVNSTAAIFKSYEEEFGALTAMVRDAINDAMDTYPVDWIPEAMQIAVAANVRTWRFVEGILKKCKAKNVRPSLSKNGGTQYANNNSGRVTKKPAGAAVVETDKSKLAEINKRRRDKQAQPAL